MIRGAITVSGQLQISGAAKAQLVAKRLVAASKRRCERDILASAPEHKQRNAALGILDPAETAAIIAHIAACRTTQNAFVVCPLGGGPP